MTPEGLLKPRYKVIADYFFNPYKVGDIITLPEKNRSVHLTTTKHTDEFGERISQEEHYAPKVIDQYPHLFKKLEWWEDRKPEEMPEYVKIQRIFEKTPCVIYKIGEGADWDFCNAELLGLKFTTGGSSMAKYMHPATEAEYNAYINKQ